MRLPCSCENLIPREQREPRKWIFHNRSRLRSLENGFDFNRVRKVSVFFVFRIFQLTAITWPCSGFLVSFYTLRHDGNMYVSVNLVYIASTSWKYYPRLVFFDQSQIRAHVFRWRIPKAKLKSLQSCMCTSGFVVYRCPFTAVCVPLVVLSIKPHVGCKREHF